ncbi:uncharacterized protein LOC113443603 [Pseudonaja textilis]|uniref:uncharacterized protein LOC113443603 n=1 Tax=Pseudonaja textilis TaxID=8673 RepID=UPI000EA9DB38|nr:uncharacterized protein LOC113443603 [Pseudonaja textilis]
MSVILTGLIQFFRPLLSSLSGVLECKGVAPWYFLTGLRIVAIFFSSGPWDSLKQDIACNWVAPTQDKSKEFCTVLCQNQYFPLAVSSTAALSFLIVILLVGLMRLTVPRKKKEDENNKITGSTSENSGRGVAVVAAGPSGASSVYLAGPRGLPMRYDHTDPRLRHHRYFHPNVWHDWGGRPMAHISGGHHPNVGLQPYGGYSMPSYFGYPDPSEMPDHCHGMFQHTMTAHPKDMQCARMTTHGPETDQYEMPSLQSSKESINAPTGYAPAPMVYKSKMPPHYRSEEKDHESFQQRYRSPKEYGDGTDYAYTMGRTSLGRNKVNPRYSEESKYSMATKCKTNSESHVDQIEAHPKPDAMSMAIKRRPVPRWKMKTKEQLAFDAPGRSDMAFDNKMGPQPWMAEDSHGRSRDENKAMTGATMAPGPTPPCPGGAACTCAGNNPCHPGPSSQPQSDPGSNAAPACNTRSIAGPQDHAGLLLANICGVPLFDIWVALLLTSETCFLCVILLLQMPRVVGRAWVCSPDAASCPEVLECAVKGRAEKRMALWGMAFTSILFIIACCGYFHIRFCCNKRCCRICSEPQGSCPGACAEETAPEGHVIRDVENGGEEPEEGL